MNRFEAQMVYWCQKMLTPSDIHKKMAFYYDPKTYNYIASSCKRLSVLGYMVRRKAGLKTFYSSTVEAVKEAMVVLALATKNDEERKKCISVVVKPLTSYIR